MKITLKTSVQVLALAIVALVASCKKDNFDNPPAGGQDPNLVANTTIADLKAGYIMDNYDTITDDIIISGIISADDKSGNFYKTLVLQDSTAGIAIRLDVSDYNTKFPIGRRLFVKCKNLILGDYNGLIQLGGYIDYSVPNQPSVAPIAYSLVDQFLVPGVYNLSVTPKVVTIPQLLASPDLYQNTLITLNQVEFKDIDTSKTYADLVNQQSANRILVDCASQEITVRSSNYATFGGSPIPNGNGALTAIFSVYGSSPQLLLRDLYDVSLDTTRCGGGVVPGGIGTGALMTVADIRNLWTGTPNIFVAGTKVRGTVISDKANSNITSKNIVIQAGSAGIVVRFTSTNTFNLNDSIEIDLSGDSLTTFSGALQINNVNISAATLKGTGTVTPNVVTCSFASANLSSLESTLVRITGVTFSGGTAGTYQGSVTMTDASGTLVMYTSSGASFATTAYPTGTHTVTGYMVRFNSTPELGIRNTTDVQ